MKKQVEYILLISTICAFISAAVVVEYPVVGALGALLFMAVSLLSNNLYEQIKEVDA